MEKVNVHLIGGPLDGRIFELELGSDDPIEKTFNFPVKDYKPSLLAFEKVVTTEGPVATRTLDTEDVWQYVHSTQRTLTHPLFLVELHCYEYRYIGRV